MLSRIASKGRKLGTQKRSEKASERAADVVPIIEDIRQAER
jgi:hypothetical protein